MALPVMQFTDPMLNRPRQVLPTIAGGISQGIGQGMNLMQQLQDLQQQKAMAPLQQQLAAGQIAALPLHQQLLQAQTALALKKATDPTAGQVLPGAAGRAQGLALLKSKFGENSEIYRSALQDYNSDIQQKLSRSDYFAANTAFKNLPQINKLQMMEVYQLAQDKRQSQGLPTQTVNEWSKQPLNASGLSVSETSTTPTLQQQSSQVGLTQAPFGQQARQTGLAAIQKFVPRQVQQKLAFATNIEKTLDQMPDAAITTYSQNPAKLASDYKLSLMGKITPEYSKYLKYMVNKDMLATQIRQFYGDSVQPAMLNKLEELANPISWRTNPKAALIKFNALKTTLEREIDTYKDQATDPKFYSGERESSILKGNNVYGQPMASKSNTQTGWSNGVYTASDGKTYTREQLLAMQGGK